MDELEFQRILNLFPVVRPRDYHADSVSSTRQSTAQPPQNEEQKEWQDAWDGSDEMEIAIQEIEHDSFWAKLKMAAEKKAMQHAHSFSVQSFKNREELADLKREFAVIKKENKSLHLKMKKLEDQAEAATKAQSLALEKVESAEAIKKVAEAEKREAEAKRFQAERELQEALAAKTAEITAADEKAYAQGMADVAEDYKLQVRQACNRGFSLGWMALVKKIDLPDDSPLRQTDNIPLPFPPPPPAESEEDSEPEDGGEEEEDTLLRKPRDAEVTKSPSLNDQVLDLTQEDEGDEVPKEAAPVVLSSDALLFGKTVEETVSEIDAEIAAENEAEVPAQQTSDVQAQSSANVQES